MRILTLNMRYGSGVEKLGDPGYDQSSSPQKLQSIADAINSLTPEIVALQEVRNQLQAENIARLTGMNSIYVSHPLGYRLYFFEWGLAFLYRLKLVEATSRTVLIDRSNGVGRVSLIASISVNGAVVAFINVHLDHIHKEVQMQNVASFLVESKEPVCLLGDLNCDPESPNLDLLKSHVSDTCLLVNTESSREALTRGTLVEAQKRRDYIWVDPHSFSVQEAGLMEPSHRRISDHIGYYADLIVR